MRKNFRGILLVLIIIMAMVIGTSCSNNSEKNATSTEKNDKSNVKKTENKEQESESVEDYNTGISYEQLARNPDDYKGKKATFSGKVLQVIEENDHTMLRLAVEDNVDTSMILTVPKSLKLKSRVLENDYITVRGSSSGLITYNSSLSGKITVPSLLVKGIEGLGGVGTDSSTEKIEKEIPKEETKKENVDTGSSRKSEYTKKLAKVEGEVDKIDVGSSTAEMKEALSRQYRKWDDLLNDIYGVLKNQLSSEDMEALKKEQRTWIKTRDSKADEASSGGGSMSELEYTGSLTETTKNRCYELVEKYMK